MSWIVCRAVKNSPGKRDATGAFIPESLLVVKALEAAGHDVVVVDVVGRPEPLWSALENVGQLEGLVYLGHGLSTSLPSLGLRGLKGARELARRVQPWSVTTGVKVTLLACSAAANPKQKNRTLDGPGTDGGFCDELRDELCRLGDVDCLVYGHISAGHTSKNPLLAAFEGLGSLQGGTGGRAVVRTKGPLGATWKALMADPSPRPSLRHRLPMMTPAEVLAEVSAAAA